jgi:hypothetical protein
MRVERVLACLLGLFLIVAHTNHQRAEEGFLMEEPNQRQVSTVSIKNTIGVVTLNDKAPDPDKRQMIQFFNKDGTLWYEFSFYNDEGAGKPASTNVDFRPLSFHLDYFVLALKCIATDASRFEVVVNEATGLTKYLRKSDRALKLDTWEDHILRLFAVDFNRLKNPVLSAPSGNVISIRIPKDTFFHPVEIKGNWLKVRWDVTDEGKNTRYGWIKWKENSNLIIDFIYFA